MASGKHSVAIIGLGSFGEALAVALSDFGDRVLGIDRDEARVSAVSEQLYRGLIADARDQHAIEQTGVDNYDVVVVAVASDLESSVLACMNVREAGVKTLWAKASTPQHARILHSIGVDRVLQPEQEFGEHIAQMLHNPALQGFMELSPRLYIGQIRLDDTHAGETLASLRLAERFELQCLGLVRGGVYQLCTNNDPLQENDGLLVLGQRTSMRTFTERS